MRSSFINSFPKWIWVWDQIMIIKKRPPSSYHSRRLVSDYLLTSGTYLIFETWILGTPTLIEWSVDGRLIKDFLPFFAKYGKKNFFRGKLKKLLVELGTSNHFTELFRVTKSVCNPDSYANCRTILRERIEISNARLYFLSQRTEHFEDFTTAC